MPEAYPTQKVGTDDLDQGNDSPSEARLALYEAVQKLNQMIGSLGAALGVCPLDTQARIPSTHVERTIGADALQTGSVTTTALASNFALPIEKGGTGKTTTYPNTDLSYTRLFSGTLALRQSTAGNHTYYIHQFQAGHRRAAHIRGLHIECSAVSSKPSAILATMPGGDKFTICSTTGNDQFTTGQAALMAFIPVDAGQYSLEIEIQTALNDYSAQVSFQILGANFKGY